MLMSKTNQETTGKKTSGRKNMDARENLKLFDEALVTTDPAGTPETSTNPAAAGAPRANTGEAHESDRKTAKTALLNAAKGGKGKSNKLSMNLGERREALTPGLQYEATLTQVTHKKTFILWKFLIQAPDGTRRVENGFTPSSSDEPKLHAWIETLQGEFPPADEAFDLNSLIGARCLAEIVEGDRDRYQRKVADILPLPGSEGDETQGTEP
jgi:hypothetical protein